MPHDTRSPAQERAMLDQIRRNIAQLRRAGTSVPSGSAQTLTYDFPLRLAPGSAGEAGFSLSALADHDPDAGKVLDYHGGNRTYDGHRGIDIALWPFPWNTLDAGAMQVVAAAAGIIVAKADANPADHNCGQPNGGDWNYLALEHADGRMTIYGHLRYHSLTGKGIGEAVARGELLGTAGSSGDSSGPHLHFEVRAASFSPVWIDPFAGPYSQAESLWTAQVPYMDPAINLLATHAGPPSMPDPCQPAVTRLRDGFDSPGNVYIYAYYRDFQGALPTELSVYRPDGDLFRSWTYTDETAFVRASSHAWLLQLTGGEPAGTWRVAATYNGGLHETYFNVDVPPAIALRSPNGGERWDPKQPQAVTWTDTLGGPVNLTLLRDGVPLALVAAKVPSEGSFQWTPGPDLVPGPGYGLRLSSVIDPALFDDSDGPFALEPARPPNPVLTKAVSDAAPRPEQPFEYVLTVGNTGSGPLSGAALSDRLPAGLTQTGPIVLEPPDRGRLGSPPAIVTDIVLAPGETLVARIPVQVDRGQPAGRSIENTASLAFDGDATPLTASARLAVADAPLVARDDRAFTRGSRPVTIRVLDNDGDPNGDPLTLTAVGVPAHGRARILGMELEYTPAPGFSGEDRFGYTLRTAAEQAEATVWVTVTAEGSALLLPLLLRR